ncbi:hypothetical protein COE80_19315 [Bacillus pseudomycoides]|uniref:hypothetical protein n=1 Tax=Bacillus pseudomycoides TaxID=64104 RepID=UPI000BFDBE0C|nr:hypothetical protein [Bacillus pseudomycoides]PHB23064.1 hypothetical protein COE80_19315 [Bacillus pseudomycoides]PHE37594.1 hypothetical protein COF51_16280 [Bacillus pseudomycoides]
MSRHFRYRQFYSLMGKGNRSKAKKASEAYHSFMGKTSSIKKMRRIHKGYGTLDKSFITVRTLWGNALMYQVGSKHHLQTLRYGTIESFTIKGEVS